MLRRERDQARETVESLENELETVQTETLETEAELRREDGGLLERHRQRRSSERPSEGTAEPGGRVFGELPWPSGGFICVVKISGCHVYFLRRKAPS